MSFINIEGECLQGETLVASLKSMFASVGSPEEYAAAVASISDRYDALESSWSRNLPFTPVCGEIAALGQEAQTLRSQIAQRYGQADVPVDNRQSPIDAAASGLSDLLKVGAVVLVACFALEAFKVSKGVA